VGTNFYFFTKDKSAAVHYFGESSYELVDEPQLGYEIHIAKTSCGWLPLFQAHKYCQSVSDMNDAYDSGYFSIYDEYGEEYDWDEFAERVLEFNGGVRGAVQPTLCDCDINSPVYDKDMPEHIPVSHFEYGNGKYASMYFTDDDGYEFTNREFS
jgi:hypothetical protein